MAVPSLPITGFRRIQIAWGDTLQQIAARELGTAARWTEIATLNGLAPPYITGDPNLASARVARYGDTLMVPDPRADIEVGATTTTDVFKRDVALPGGELHVVDGDLALIAGRDNLRQALTHRVRVPRGELLFHPGYGCDVAKLKGQRNTDVAALLGAKYVERAVRTDARIARVIQATATANGDNIGIEVEAMTVSGHPIDTTTTV